MIYRQIWSVLFADWSLPKNHTPMIIPKFKPSFQPESSIFTWCRTRSRLLAAKYPWSLRPIVVLVSSYPPPYLCVPPFFLTCYTVSFLPTFPWYVTPFYLKVFEGWPVWQVLIVIFNTLPPFHYALVEVTLHLRRRTQCCLPDVQGWLLGHISKITVHFSAFSCFSACCKWTSQKAQKLLYWNMY